MPESQDIIELLLEGNAVEAAGLLAGLEVDEYARLARLVADRARESGRIPEIIDMLLAEPSFPVGTSEAARLQRREGMRILAAETAIAADCLEWQDLVRVARVLAADTTYRVQEAAVRLVSRVASEAFSETLSSWREFLLDSEAALGVCVLRGVAESQASVSGALELFSSVRSDLRRDIRRNLGPRALPQLGRREPRAVYEALRNWSSEEDEIARWNVAEALSTPLGGIYVEEAMEILEILAIDERPSVWQAAARAIIVLAQRRPAFVLPILARWRGDFLHRSCAQMALEALVRR